MHTSTILAFLLPALATSLPTLESRQTANTTACATGVHIIVARASTEKPGEGIIGAVATNVKQSIPGSDSEAVDYPATLTDYFASEGLGVSGMTKLISNYATRCPGSKMVLMGYSQGAQVIGDVMCGTSEAGFNATAPLSTALSKDIIAVVQMGDPTFLTNQPQGVGNATKGGIFARLNTNSTSCTAMGTIAKSFCDADDRFCDGGSSIAVHQGYVKEYGTQAAEFVVARAGNGTI